MHAREIAPSATGLGGRWFESFVLGRRESLRRSRLVDKSGAQAYRTRWRRCCQHVVRCLWISDGARSLRKSLGVARRRYRDPAACGQARVQANGDISRDRSACRICCDRLRPVATSQRRPRCHYGDAVADPCGQPRPASPRSLEREPGSSRSRQIRTSVARELRCAAHVAARGASSTGVRVRGILWTSLVISFSGRS